MTTPVTLVKLEV